MKIRSTFTFVTIIVGIVLYKTSVVFCLVLSFFFFVFESTIFVLSTSSAFVFTYQNLFDSIIVLDGR